MNTNFKKAQDSSDLDSARRYTSDALSYPASPRHDPLCCGRRKPLPQLRSLLLPFFIQLYFKNLLPIDVSRKITSLFSYNKPKDIKHKKH